MPSPFPCSSVICESLWKETQIGKKVIVSFVLLLQTQIYSFGTNKESDFFELWQQHKHLKTMDMSEAWPDAYDGKYIQNLK